MIEHCNVCLWYLAFLYGIVLSFTVPCFFMIESGTDVGHEDSYDHFPSEDPAQGKTSEQACKAHNPLLFMLIPCFLLMLALGYDVVDVL
jgi:hypothetical protein